MLRFMNAFSLEQIPQLEYFDLSANEFCLLPPVVCKLRNLKRLNLSGNTELIRLDKDILQLDNLDYLNCDNSSKLKFPPYPVCKRGVKAVMQSLESYSDKEPIEFIQAPISLLGKSLSGKTSVIQSLKEGKPSLTSYDENRPIDRMTQVSIVELELGDSSVKVIDGNEMFHSFHQLRIWEEILPVMVMNMETFSELSKSYGPKEATKNLYFSWLSHLYVACPKLGSPILVLTHTDQLKKSQEAKEQLLEMVKVIKREILDEEIPVRHLFTTKLFELNQHETFDLNVTTDLKSLQQSLNERCKGFTVELPYLWRDVVDYLERQSAHPYVTLDKLRLIFKGSDLPSILQCMHNACRILWLKDDNKLSHIIFHRISVVAEIVSFLFPQQDKPPWIHHSDFLPFIDEQDRVIDEGLFKSLVKQFNSTGILDEALLVYLLQRHPQVDFKIALALLRHFFIFYGPVIHENKKVFILPYASSEFMDDSWERDGDVQLRIDFVVKGLSVQWYVFQLLTVAVLNHSLIGSDSGLDKFSVKRNGLTIYHGKSAMHLVHDCNNGKVCLQVSTPTAILGESWKLFIQAAIAILNLLSKTWNMQHVETLVYCANCLFLHDVRPGFAADPDWFYEIYNQESTIILESMFSDFMPCSRCFVRTPSVPKPLKFPCEFYLLSYAYITSICYDWFAAAC